MTQPPSPYGDQSEPRGDEPPAEPTNIWTGPQPPAPAVPPPPEPAPPAFPPPAPFPAAPAFPAPPPLPESSAPEQPPYQPPAPPSYEPPAPPSYQPPAAPSYEQPTAVAPYSSADAPTSVPAPITVPASQAYPPGPYAPPGYGFDPVTGQPLSDKSKVIAGLLQIGLAIMIGVGGVGRLYAGNTQLGAIQIGASVVGWICLCCGIFLLFVPAVVYIGFVIWFVVDGIMMLTGRPVDGQGRLLRS